MLTPGLEFDGSHILPDPLAMVASCRIRRLIFAKDLDCRGLSSCSMMWHSFRRKTCTQLALYAMLVVLLNRWTMRNGDIVRRTTVERARRAI